MSASRIVLATAVLGLCLTARSQSTIESFVVSGKDAYLVGPPRLVSGGVVQDLQFSPDSRLALVAGVDPPRATAAELLQAVLQGQGFEGAKTFLKLWNLQNDTVRDVSPAILSLLGTFGDEMGFYGLRWTSVPGVALHESVSEPTTGESYESTIRRINFNDGSVTVVRSLKLEQGQVALIHVSPTKPMFVSLVQSSNKPIDVRDIKTTIRFSVCDLGGKETKGGQAVVNGRAAFTGWTKDGQNLVGRALRRKSSATRAEQTPIVLNPVTGQISDTQEKLEIHGEETVESPLIPVIATAETRLREDKAETQSLWLGAPLASENQQCLVANGVDGPVWLTPTCDRIAYLAQSRLFVSDVIRVDYAVYVQAREAAVRAEAMNRAKQVALAVLIFSADNDDRYPTPAAFEQDILPYVKDRELLQGFVYTFPGGSATNVESPSETELGYVTVKGGRCVAYVDGHVKFIKDK